MIGNIFRFIGYVLAAVWTLFKIVIDILLVIIIIAILAAIFG